MTEPFPKTVTINGEDINVVVSDDYEQPTKGFVYLVVD